MPGSVQQDGGAGMEQFNWATSNFDVATPQELQGAGVNVFFAPQISPETKVVDLADGSVTIFREGQARPTDGCYADYDGLVRYCRRHGLPLTEINGQVGIMPSATRAAGDPLAHGEAAPLTSNPEALAAEAMGEQSQPDPQGAYGGDTGESERVGKGTQAEKGDQRRNLDAHTGQTRGGKAGGIRATHDDRTGSRSNASR